jgi:hypothetical protein
MKILLANIGNRNILYQNRLFDKSIDGEFKAWTHGLLFNYELIKNELSVNILDKILEAETFEKVILFSTNQINEARQDQDTLYEAEILQKLIEREYKLETDIDYQVQCKVTDNDELLKYYKKELKKIKNEYPTAKILVCDAGGTAQQKSSLKIMLEFIYPKDQFEVRYVNRDGTIELVPNLQYRNVILAEQIKELIEIGEYKAATKLMGFGNPIDCAKDSQTVVKMLGLSHILFEKQWSQLQTFVNNANQKQLKNSPLLKRIRDQKSQIESYEIAEIFDEWDLFILGELFSQVQFLWSRELYNAAIFTFALFYENYLYQSISYSLDYNLRDNYEEEIIKLKREAKEKFANVARAYGKNEIKNDGIPFKIQIAENITNTAHLKFLQLLKPYISDGRYFHVNPDKKEILAINTVRNKIAHRGIVMTKKAIKTELPYFQFLLSQIEVLFNFSKENQFDKLNSFVVENI